MNTIIDKQLLSRVILFYTRALTYPYDEQTHEFHHLFREAEKMISSDADNTLAAKLLDVINFYQGEDMITLQSEYVRMFTPRDNAPPFISLSLSDLDSEVDLTELLRELEEGVLFAEINEEPEVITNVMEHFAALLEYEEDERIEHFYKSYLKTPLQVLSKKVYAGAGINFFKEFSKGLGEMVVLLG